MALRIDVISIFPNLVDTFCSDALVGKARQRHLLDLRTHDPRDYTHDVHRSVDDAPFGGGAGMVMRPEPLFECVEAAQPPRPILLLGPAGERFDQARARQLATSEGFTLLCGRYEGVDQRVVDHLCDGELSIGDVVLSGGEAAACVVIEAVTRLLPGMMGNAASALDESFNAERSLLEYPHYTRPADYRGWPVPDTLRSGDHARIERWRRAQSLARTIERRPDLLAPSNPSAIAAAGTAAIAAPGTAAGTDSGTVSGSTGHTKAAPPPLSAADIALLAEFGLDHLT
jgi:tRNA (guanine37-N1)-methyltransferase